MGLQYFIYNSGILSALRFTIFQIHTYMHTSREYLKIKLMKFLPHNV